MPTTSQFSVALAIAGVKTPGQHIRKLLKKLINKLTNKTLRK